MFEPADDSWGLISKFRWPRFEHQVPAVWRSRLQSAHPEEDDICTISWPRVRMRRYKGFMWEPRTLVCALSSYDVVDKVDEYIACRGCIAFVPVFLLCYMRWLGLCTMSAPCFDCCACVVFLAVLLLVLTQRDSAGSGWSPFSTTILNTVLLLLLTPPQKTVSREHDWPRKQQRTST